MTSTDLSNKILTEISKTGFPLELRVSNYLHKNDYLVANNIYYVDLDEGKGRELDIRALKNYEIKKEKNTFYCRNWYFIECKKSKKKPWVFFTSPQTPYDVDLFRLGCKGSMYSPTEGWHVPEIMSKLHKIHPFINATNFGRSYMEAFKDFESGKAILNSLVSSAKSVAMAKFKESENTSIGINHYYPIVVFEGDLYEAYLDNDEIFLRESNIIYVSFFYQSPKYEDGKYIIPVVKEKYLPQLIASLDDVLGFIGDKAKENLNLLKKGI